MKAFIRLVSVIATALSISIQAESFVSFSDPALNIRLSHSALTLANGDVLVAGGENSDGPTRQTHIYRSGFGMVAAGPSLSMERMKPTLTQLSSGQVLITGGGLSTDVAEIWDGVSTVTDTSTRLTRARGEHTATLLANGQVLLAGGRGNTGLIAETELFDGSRFTAGPALQTGRTMHTATALPDGRVVVIGGVGAAGVLSSVEVYTPGSGFAHAGNLIRPRYKHTATLLSSGKILVAGGGEGEENDFLASAELFDPGTGISTLTGSMRSARNSHTATALPGKRTLIAGGWSGTGEAAPFGEIYHENGGAFLPTATMDTARAGHQAAAISNGRVLIVGGIMGSGQPAGVLEIYTARPVEDKAPLIQLTPGSFAIGEGQAYDLGADIGPIAAGDLNRDGNQDIVAGQIFGSEIVVMLGNGDGTLRSATAHNVSVNGGTAQPNEIVLADMDRDGNLDVVSANGGWSGSSIAVLYGDGSGGFSETKFLTHPAGSPSSVAVGDFTWLGNPDIAASGVNTHPHGGLIFHAGHFERTIDGARYFYGGPLHARAITVGDFNGDLALDAAIANDDSDVVTIVHGDHLGGFNSSRTNTVGNDPSALCAGDFNGDGLTDLAVANRADGNISVLLRNGLDSFAPHTRYGSMTGNAFESVRAADLNGDGALDLVTSEFISRRFGVLLGRGDGTFERTAAFGTRRHYETALADLNNDGMTDVATADYDSKSVSVFLNQTRILAAEYRAGAEPVLLDATARLRDPDTDAYANSMLMIAPWNGVAGDILAVKLEGNGAGQFSSADGARLKFEGVELATLSGGRDGQSLDISFDAGVSPRVVEQALRKITFQSGSGESAAGERLIEIVMMDFGAGLTGLSAFKRVQVTAVNEPPTLAPLAVSTLEDHAKAFVITAHDPEGEPLTYAITRGPRRGALSGTAPDLTYTPFRDVFGMDSFEFTVSDGEHTVAGSATITIAPVNDAPTVYPLTIYLAQDSAATFALEGEDPEGADLSFDAGSWPLNGDLSLDLESGTYVPHAGFFGEDSFTYFANDGGTNSAPAQVRLIVNTAPVLTNVSPSSMAMPPSNPFLHLNGLRFSDGAILRINGVETYAEVFGSTAATGFIGTNVFPTLNEDILAATVELVNIPGLVSNPKMLTLFDPSRVIGANSGISVTEEAAQAVVFNGSFGVEIEADRTGMRGQTIVTAGLLSTNAAQSPLGGVGPYFTLRHPGTNAQPPIYAQAYYPGGVYDEANLRVLYFTQTNWAVLRAGAALTNDTSDSMPHGAPVGGKFSIALNSLTGFSPHDPAKPLFAMAHRPIITSIWPESIPANWPEPVTVYLSGLFFMPHSELLVNGARRSFELINGEMVLTLEPADLASSEDIKSLSFVVRHNLDNDSNGRSTTLVSSKVNTDTLASTTVVDETPVVVSTPESAPAGVSVNFQKQPGADPVTITVANYTEAPAAPSFSAVEGSYVDLQVTGVSPSDVLSARFYIPAGQDIAGLELKWFNPAADVDGEWELVFNVNGSQPAPQPLAAGSAYSGYFDVTFAADSVPSITQLTGTFFATGRKDLPPTVSCADVVLPASPELLVEANFPAPLISDDRDVSAVTYSYSQTTFPVGVTVVTCTATDSAGNTAQTTFRVTRAALGFSGFASPIGGADESGGTYAARLRAFKLGSTVPVRFSAYAGTEPLMTGVHTLRLAKYSNATTAAEAIDATPRDAASTGSAFTYSEGVWKLNLDTKSTGLERGIWQLKARLSDGSEHNAWIELK